MACTMQASEAFPCLFAWCSCGRIGGTVTLQSLAKTSKEHDADAHPQRAYPQKAGSLASKTEDRQATSNKQQSPKPKATLPSLPEKKSRRMRRPRARRRRPSALRSLPSCGTGAPWPQPRRSPRSSAGPAPRRRETTRRRHDDFSETLLSLASLTAAPRGDARRSHCHENLRLRYVGCEKSRKLR